MAQQQKKKPVAKTVVYGLATVALYTGVFSFADNITAHFAQGSLWAAGPILTVFAVSYAHGAFASNLWSCLGIEAKRQRKDVRATQPAQRPQLRAEMSA